VVLRNRVERGEGRESLDRGEVGVGGLLKKSQFRGDGVRVVGGSGLQGNETPTDPKAAEPIWKLMEAVDSYIPTPPRPVDKPFLMPIEDIFSITGRGTVVTGRGERGGGKGGGGNEMRRGHSHSRASG